MRTIIATVVALAFAATLYAHDVAFVACSADHKTMTLNAELRDGTSERVVNEIGDAFARMAHQLTAGQVQGTEGFKLFVSYLTEEDDDAIESFYSAPVVGPECK